MHHREKIMNIGNVSASQLLLSPKPIREFSPEDFLEYVRSLYGVREKRKKIPKSGAQGLSSYRTKTGRLVITCRRDWKWITEAELEFIGQLQQEPLNKLFLYVRHQGFTVVPDAKRAAEITEAVKEIPW